MGEGVNHSFEAGVCVNDPVQHSVGPVQTSGASLAWSLHPTSKGKSAHGGWVKGSAVLLQSPWIQRGSEERGCAGRISAWIWTVHTADCTPDSTTIYEVQKWHLSELLAEVAVDDVLDGEVGGAVGQVVAAAQGRVLLPQVHLQVQEEVHVLPRRERQHRPCRPHPDSRARPMNVATRVQRTLHTSEDLCL